MDNININKPLTCKLLLALVCMAVQIAATGAKADDKIRDMIRSQGYIDIDLIEAKVPDLDVLPGQGDSDTYVRVLLNRTNELICESKIVQDQDKPKFDTKCRTKNIVPAVSIIRFELYDSDKPSPQPDKIGFTRFRVSDLILQRKLDTIETFPIEGRQYPKYHIKARIGFKPIKRSV